jgi:branched-chain amino acid transport system permease protein
MLLYPTAGRFDTSYTDDRRIITHPFDRWIIIALLLFAFFVIPWIGDSYIIDAILLPFLALSLAAVGLNLLTGYAGQVSVGSAAFMAVGAFAAYNFNLRVPGLPLLVSFVLAGIAAAVIGTFFGLPSLRLKGFYLLVSTLAAQFFVQWTLTQFPWFANDDPSGVITAPSLRIAGINLDSSQGRYVLSLAIVVILTAIAVRLSRSQTGRNWIAVRDMDIAAKVIGVPVFQTKLLAFAISSFYCGIAGILWAFTYLRTVESDGFNLDHSFEVLFIIIIGGLASIHGAFFGAGFIVVLPLILSRLGASVFGTTDAGTVELIENLIIGLLIIVILVTEPAGLVGLWKKFKQRVESWPFIC